MSYEQFFTDYKDILLPEDVQKILHTGQNTVYNYLALSEGITYPNFFPGSLSESGFPRKMCA